MIKRKPNTLFTKKELQTKQKQIDKAKYALVIYGLNDVHDLAEIIKHIIIDGKRTYYKGINKIQCGPNRARTIQDIYKVTKGYIPDITYEQVHNAITILYPQGDPEGNFKSDPYQAFSYPRHLQGKDLLMPNYCHTVKKIVHHARNIALTTRDIRKAIGDLNVKNPKYVRPSRTPRNIDK